MAMLHRWPLRVVVAISFAIFPGFGCRADPKPIIYSREDSIRQCLTLGGAWGSPEFARCLADRYGWASDSVVQMIEDSTKAYELTMAKIRAAMRDSLIAEAARDSAARARAQRAEAQALRVREAEDARKQAIVDSMDTERARRQLKAMAPKP